jgi:hypothetical protein
MRRRLTGAILLLYPRQVREGHGPEIVALIDDLIAHEGRSRAPLFIRLAVDGLVQRIASAAAAWTVVAVLVATSFGGLAVSDFAAANAFHVVPPAVHTVAPVRHTHQTPHHPRRWHRTSRRSTGMIARRLTLERSSGDAATDQAGDRRLTIPTVTAAANRWGRLSGR